LIQRRGAIFILVVAIHRIMGAVYYIAGIVRNENQKLISINGMPDHTHVLVGLKPDMAISDGEREIQLARRLWCILVFSFAARCGGALY